MTKNRKGISAIVATVMIILVTVAAVTIVWAAIIPMINSNLEKATVCNGANMGLKIVNTGYTCYNVGNISDINDNGSISVNVGRETSDFELADIQFVFSKGGSSTSVVIENSDKTAPVTGLNSDVYTFNASSLGIAGDLDSTSVFESVQIVPIVKVGNTEKLCDLGSPIQLSACS